MNSFISFLEKKVGKYAISNLPLYMIICYGIGYIMQLINPAIILTLSLNPYAIVHGQVWRIFTWLLIPPDSSNFFFMLIMLYFYYSIGTSLERTWGTFYFNYYIFTGILFTLIGSFLYFGYSYLFKADEIIYVDQILTAKQGTIPALYGDSWYFAYYSTTFSTYYINMSIFLAFAATFPEAQVWLFMILPIKVKVLGIIYGILLVFEALQQGVDGLFVIGASLLNFILFFFTTRRSFKSNLNRLKREFQKKQQEREIKIQKMKPNAVSKHKCAICGRTDESNPELQFRFCSKCEGNYEYCQDHLFSHKHFTRN